MGSLGLRPLCCACTAPMLTSINVPLISIIILVGISMTCIEAPVDTTTDAPTTTETPENTNDCSALEGWLAASIVIIIILISLCVALVILSVFLRMKYRKCQNDVALGTSATYKPAATGSPTPPDAQEVKVNA